MDDYILLEERYGKHSNGTGYYYRPIGGTIEFGEKSDETLVREFKEELDAEIIVNRHITCLENIFYIDENIGHEITQIYVVDFKNESLYEKEDFSVVEGNTVTHARWIAKEEILSGNKVLYPNGLADILKEVINLEG
jgi:8-oxo-dGTP pyrophosphatase MutT (NUDIX family)